MKKPDRTRINRAWRRVIAPPPDQDLRAVASRATYGGSAYHKDTLSFVGMPQRRVRADASICPRDLAHDRDRIEGWLRAAIESGHVGVWNGPFPNQVWHRENDVVFEALLTGTGVYHGYPLHADESVEGLP